MIEVIREKSDILLVSFGGLALQVGFPIPEFKRILSPINLSKIFVVDQYRCWYYRIIDEVTKELQKLIDELKPKRTIFFGVSAGGYASILFGTMLQVDHVMAFNTQSFLSPEMRIKYKDTRWPDQINDVYKYHKNLPLDLWKYDKKCKTFIELFYCENYYLYKTHSEVFNKRTKKFNIKMNPYKCKNSALAKNLKNSGELFNIFLKRIKKYENEIVGG